MSEDAALPGPPRESAGVTALQAAGLFALTTLVFLPSVRCGFIWDDDDYVTHNAVMEGAGGLARIWFDRGSTPQYYPLVFTTFWIERRLWGLDPAGYHAVNVALHGLAAAALFLVLRALRVPFAWLAAAAFAIHPVQAESVVWITERKNVLSGLFCFLALRAWLGRRNESGGGWYWTSLALFICALLSKTTTSTLPAAIVVLTIWRKGRITRGEALRLAPMFALGLAFGLHTAWVERHLVGAKGDEWELGWPDRLHIAGRAPIFYAAKVLFPQPLCFIYPRWAVGGPLAWKALPGILMAAAGLAAAMHARRNGAPLAALACFLIALFPALGFFNVYPFVYSFVADHFQYLATAPFFALVVPWLARMAFAAPPWSAPLRTGWIILALGALAAGSVAATASYADVETLWRENARRNPRGTIAYVNLGAMHMERGDLEAAIGALGEGARIVPESDEILSSLGGALVTAGRIEEGAAVLARARELNPDRLSLLNNLALLALAQGRPAKAERLAREVIARDPAEVMAYNNLAAALDQTGRHEEAAEALREGLRRAPDNPMLRGNLEQLTGTPTRDVN